MFLVVCTSSDDKGESCGWCSSKSGAAQQFIGKSLWTSMSSSVIYFHIVCLAQLNGITFLVN